MNDPSLRVEVQGPFAEKGSLYCATCCLLWLGRISSDEGIMASAQEQAELALSEGKTELIINPPHPYKIWKVRKAVTIAGSVHFPVIMDRGDGNYIATGMPAMPVCWIHLQGMTPRRVGTQEESGTPSTLVEGKKGQVT